MKNKKFLVNLIIYHLFSFFFLGLVSCKDDNEGDNANKYPEFFQTLIGKWSGNSSHYLYEWEFKESGNYYYKSTRENGSVWEEITGDFEIKTQDGKYYINCVEETIYYDGKLHEYNTGFEMMYEVAILSSSSIRIAGITLNRIGGFNSTQNNPVSCSGLHDGHDFVDLGLSVMWATCNIGANNPENYGSYFAWGETEEKDYYSYENYAFMKRKTPGYYYYNINNGDISGSKFDAAFIKWGGDWRMPTKADFKEIEDKCSSQWISYNGVNGRLYTAPNGNSVFFPASGEKSGYENDELGKYGNYWTSTIALEFADGNGHYPCAKTFAFTDSYFSGNSYQGYRSDGLPIRAVFASSSSMDDNGTGNDDNHSDGDAPRIISFTYTATKNSITVKFMATDKPTSATIKYGESSATKSLSSSITNKQISATARGLKSGTKYYFKCTVKNSNGSSTSEEYPAYTNY